MIPTGSVGVFFADPLAAIRCPRCHCVDTPISEPSPGKNLVKLLCWECGEMLGAHLLRDDWHHGNNVARTRGSLGTNRGRVIRR